MKALIFGANGQDGFYLFDRLRKMQVEALPVSRSGKEILGDVSDANFVKALIKTHQPEYIFHLAANSTTRHEAIFENHQTISTGTLNILEAVKTVSPSSKVFISGSGLQFKNANQPIKETAEFEARDAYSVSRIQSVYAARYYRSLGIKTYVGYFFNHDSPRRTEKHVSKLIAESVKRIARGEDLQISIGDPLVIKEWGYAADIVEAAWTLTQQEDVYEAVLGTGRGYSIQEYIECCFANIQKDWRRHLTIQEGYRAEYRSLVSDPATIFSLGWKPRVDFQELVKKMITE